MNEIQGYTIILLLGIILGTLLRIANILGG